MTETPSTLSILREARELVARGWCQRVSARDADGRVVWRFSDNAAQVCLTAALERVCESASNGYLAAASAMVAKLPQGLSLVEFNDAPGRTQAEVLAAFDAAIALLDTPHAR